MTMAAKAESRKGEYIIGGVALALTIAGLGYFGLRSILHWVGMSRIEVVHA